MHHLPTRLVQWDSDYKFTSGVSLYINVLPGYQASAMGLRLQNHHQGRLLHCCTTYQACPMRLRLQIHQPSRALHHCNGTQIIDRPLGLVIQKTSLVPRFNSRIQYDLHLVTPVHFLLFAFFFVFPPSES